MSPRPGADHRHTRWSACGQRRGGGGSGRKRSGCGLGGGWRDDGLGVSGWVLRRETAGRVGCEKPEKKRGRGRWAEVIWDDSTDRVSNARRVASCLHGRTWRIRRGLRGVAWLGSCRLRFHGSRSRHPRQLRRSASAPTSSMPMSRPSFDWCDGAASAWCRSRSWSAGRAENAERVWGNG